MPLHCPDCEQIVFVTEPCAPNTVCPTCGKTLSMAGPAGHLDGTVAMLASPQQELIDRTVDTRTNPATAEPFGGTSEGEQTTTHHAASSPTDQRCDVTIDVTVDHRTGQTSSLAELDRLEKVLQQFEEVWKAGGTPSIADFLTGEPSRAELLFELVHLDLSYRLSVGQDARVEQYFEQFPELQQDRVDVIDLILAEFRLRSRHGMRPDAQAFAQRFPEHTGELKALLKRPPQSRRSRLPIRLNCPHCRNAVAVADREDERDVVCPACHSAFRVDADSTQSFAPESLPLVGRFQLLRVLGRGAFGAVYQARDTKLNRLVALKIPRSGTFSSREDEERFVAEAEHAAQLNHAGIVQVYDVGRTDEYPYIVSEFVRGVTLSDVLTARRMEFAEAARLVATIADALHHAHEHQVIHRDLKPANIMIDADDNPRVMDFGLAKRQVSEVTVTLDGSILGTPAYMSPEQAGGKSQSADRRSDVYSLGVILFELLSGERPFRGNSVMLLRQVVQVEAPKLRQLNDKIPFDLDTIAAKCLEKDPDRRYQTSQELAEDLRRHLNHEPIHARPIGSIERAGRWCKRNPLLVKSAAAVFATLLIALCIVSLFWRSESIQRRLAAELAEDNRDLYEQEQAAKREVLTARNAALARLRDARRATDLWLTVFPQQLEELAGGPEVREKFLRQAAADYEEFARQQSNDPDLELERGRSWLRLGDVRRLLAQDEPALLSYQQAATVFTTLREGSDAARVETATELASAWLGMGLVLQDRGQFPEAEQHLERAVSLLTELLNNHANDARPAEVLAAAELDLAVLRFQTGKATEAQATVSRAVKRYARLCDLQPAEPRHRLGRASAESMSGELLAQSGDDEDARAVFQRVLASLDELVKEAPENTEYLRARAEKRILLASVLRSLGDTQAELTAYEASVADYVQVDQRRPGLPVIRQQLAICLADQGNLLQHLERSREAESPLVDSITLSDQLATAYQRPEYHEQAAAARALLGEVYRELGEYEKSEQLLRAAVTTYAQLAEAIPDVVDYMERQAIARGQLGQTLAAMDRLEDAAHELRAAATALDSLLELAPATPRYLNAAAYTNWHLGEALLSASPEAAESALQQAVALWDRATSTTPSPEYLDSFAWFFVTCAEAKLQDGGRAIQLAERAVTLQPTNARYRTTLGGAYFRHGDLANCAKTLVPLVSAGDCPAAGRFFLAMALANDGQLTEALTHHEAGKSWLLANQPGNRRLWRLQQETLAVLDDRASDAREE